MQNIHTVLKTPDPLAIAHKIAELEAKIHALESVIVISNKNVTIRADHILMKANISVMIQAPGGYVNADLTGVSLVGGPIRCAGSQFTVDSGAAQFSLSTCTFSCAIYAPVVTSAKGACSGAPL